MLISECCQAWAIYYLPQLITPILLEFFLDDTKVCSNTNLHNDKINVLVNSIENNIEAEHDKILRTTSENITESLI